MAVEAALAAGAPAVWINAGGDLRAEGIEVPVMLRDEASGGVRPWANLADGAVATSCFAPGARSRLHSTRYQEKSWHLSVTAPSCMWADALTKVAAQAASTPSTELQTLLDRYDAQYWLHDQRGQMH
jgi:thiamine biosynthesis lipoprotein